MASAVNSKRKLKGQEAERLLKEVRERIDEAWQHDRDNRREAATDLAFLAGDQWPASVRRERNDEGRPVLTINALPQFVRQVTNDIRQADLSIKVAPVDAGSDKDLAKIYNGILKQIQYQSSAKAVYSAAAEHQCGCGMGWWRVITEYTEDTAFDQEIRIKLIRNPLSVYVDPGATEPDRSDAMWVAVTEIWPKATFKAKYPKASAEDLDVSSDENERAIFWTAAETVRVAEYWRKVPHTKTLALLEDGSTVDITGRGEGELGMLPIVKTREAEAYKIESFLVSGADILEGPSEWPGKYIPLIPAIGDETPLEGKTYRSSVIRFARDAQQLYNYNKTGIAESIALAPKAPYLVTPTMIGEYKSFWDNANKKPRPYLPYNPDPDAPGAKPYREHPPEMPAALMAEAQNAYDDMKKTTGIYDASLGARSNETSGIAIKRRELQGDTANYHYSDNLQRSLEHCGRVLIDLIPKIYDNERVIRILGDDESKEEFLPINKVTMGIDGMPVVMNDLSTARFDVRVTIGPSYATKRIEAAESILQFAQAVPQVGQVAPDLIAKALDFEGAEEVAKRLKNTIPPNILADPEDPNTQPPDPMDDPAFQLDMREKAAKSAKLEAEAEGKHLENMATYGMLTASPGIFDQGLGGPQQEPGPTPEEVGMMGMDQMPPEEFNPEAMQDMPPQGMPPPY